jgi:hypothetical protein
MPAPCRFEPCPTCCEACTGCPGGHPAQVQATISGMANGSCSDCASIDGVYVLDFVGDLPDLSANMALPGMCWWKYSFASPLCGGQITQMVFGMMRTTPATYAWLFLGHGDLWADQVYGWDHARFPAIDCTAFSHAINAPMAWSVCATGDGKFSSVVAL